MKFFEEDAECIKCGCKDVTSHFYEKGWHGDLKQVTQQDLIKRFCKRCGFDWLELPLDAEAVSTKQKANNKTWQENWRRINVHGRS
jgi:predicted nucleic-acid-binding Zn-ribbon protein